MFSLQTKLIAVVVLLSALIGCYFYGRHDGAALERSAWQKRDNDALRQANADIDAAHRKNRELERALGRALRPGERGVSKGDHRCP